jgi:hypothetical protein
MSTSKIIAALLATAFAGGAFAQTVQQDVQRDVNQQKRIEQGLQSGSLNVKEAGRLEAQEAKIDRMEKRDLKDGKITPAEQARLTAEQNKVSREIHADKTNGVHGNPDSVSSRRMQADVQRNINQEQRIDNGIKDGQLTNRQVGRLEGGQAHVDQKEANAAANGHISKAEQRGIQHAENHQSARIHRDRVNGSKG